MLLLPDDHRALRLIGIDPGTNLGVATLDLDLKTNSLYLIDVNTFDGTKLAREYTSITEVHGHRAARNIAHENNLVGYFYYMEPHYILSESPYMGRFPQAFASLTECIMSIRRAVLRYDPIMPLLLVDPPTVKTSLGVRGKSSDKEEMKRALLNLSSLINVSGYDISYLDEHGIDAIAVAFTKAQSIMNATGI